ncbi:MAG: hypothetical protein QGI21_06780 [Candidatus Poseidoniaceae archaeon]|jgi:DNA polymerase III delta prime subunit|nr:hypothetical protein [Candidatus Poseidoniaceae archaeon]
MTTQKQFDTSIEDAKAIVKHHLNMLWDSPQSAKITPPLMIWGPPGVGKSTFIQDLTEEEGIGFIDVRLAQREPVDIRGLPVPREDRKGIDWIISSEWPRENSDEFKQKGIILFDEITAADATLQVAAYEFILDRRLGKLYQVPDGWYIIAAGNRSSDGAVARTMSSALANRFCHLEVSSNSEEWTKWAVINDIHPSVIGFIRHSPQLLFNMNGNKERGWPSPRTWERVSAEIKAAENCSLPKDLLETIIQGLIGIGAAIEFTGFLEWNDKVPSVSDLLMQNAKLEIPERSDQRYGFISAMVYYFKKNEDPVQLFEGLYDILLELPNDWTQLAYHDIELSLRASNRIDVMKEFMQHERHKMVEDKLAVV